MVKPPSTLVDDLGCRNIAGKDYRIAFLGVAAVILNNERNELPGEKAAGRATRCPSNQ